MFADFVADQTGPVTSEGRLVHRTAPSGLVAEELLDALTARTGSYFLIHCHGDGAHGNFGSVVLCGLCDDQEHLTDGRLGCCRILSDGSFICKRSSDGVRRPVRSGDLGAVTLCLLTCGGSSVSGQIYPSDCSFVLSAAEGFPAAVLTVGGRVRFAREDMEGAAELLSGGRPLGEIAQALNEARAAVSGERPFVLFGDPTFAPVSGLPHPEDAAVAPTKATSLDAVPRTISQSRPSRSRAEVSEIAGVLGRRLRMQDQILSSSALLDAPLTDGDCAAFDAHGRALRVARGHLGLAYELADCSRRITEEEIDVWFAALAGMIAVIDQSLAALIHFHLPQRCLEHLFTTGLIRSATPSEAKCAQCGAFLTIERHSSPLISPEYTVVTTCNHCGPESAWDSDGPLIHVALPRLASVGSTLAVSIDVCRRPLLPTAYATVPLASVRFRDVGKSRDEDIEGCGVGPAPRKAILRLRPDATLENSTIRVAAVHELSVAFRRASVIVLP
jgi:hypothetical protein